MDRAPGWRSPKLTLSYAGFLMLAGAVLLAAVWVFLLRDVPEVAVGPGGGVQRLSSCATSRRPRARHWSSCWCSVSRRVFLAGRMLAPLTRITDATRMAANGSLSPDPSGRPQRRAHELADSFDAMLARLEAQVAEQQRFAANASHELRTPLAVTQTLLDVACNDPNRDNGELVERLHVVNARAIGLD